MDDGLGEVVLKGDKVYYKKVSILLVMDDGLGGFTRFGRTAPQGVSILLVMDDGLGASLICL